MDLFQELVLKCDLLIFRCCVNGKIPAGVLKEINWAKENSIFTLELPSFINREMSVDDTRNMLLEMGTR